MDRPNILLIMSDQHNRQVMGCAGHPAVQTPALDALARDGVRFSQAYCNHPLCGPSRMSFLTSQYSSDIRVWTNACRLSSDAPTFLHPLNEAGYRTMLCGRMHFNGPDQRHGFQERLIGDRGREIAPDFIKKAEGQVPETLKRSGAGYTGYHDYDRAVTDRCVAELQAIADDRDAPPFFMTVGLFQPHPPFICPPELYARYADLAEAPQLPPDYLETLHPAMLDWRNRRQLDSGEVGDAEIRRCRAAYYGLVSMVDAFVGQIRDTLAATGLAEDTIVIYTSDHGDMAGEHRAFWKSNLYEGPTGVPLIIHDPRRSTPGRQVPRPCSLLDLGPTVLELAGAAPLATARGRSLAPFLDPATPPAQVDWTDRVISERGGEWGDPIARMIRRGPWKLNSYYGYTQPQLFNLQDDPHELHDLGADPVHAEVRQDLLADLNQDWDPVALAAYEDAQRAVMAELYSYRPPPSEVWNGPSHNEFPLEN